MQLYNTLVPHVQDAQSRQAVQQQIGIYNRGIVQLTTLRQPIAGFERGEGYGLTAGHVARLAADHAQDAPISGRRWRAHSLEYLVMKQTGHKSREVLGAYIRTGEIFEQNAAKRLWAA